MDTMADLSRLFVIPIETLNRHVIQPLASPLVEVPKRWKEYIPDSYRQLLSICDGIDFFGTQPWDRCRLWGSSDFDNDILHSSCQIGVFPIFGEIPHLTSIRLSDGAIVSTDWEVEGDARNGWLRPIAENLSEYVQTIIKVQEAYGDPPDGMPADWWGPYALYGNRYDLDHVADSKRS